MQFLEESDEGIIAEAERLAAEIEQQKKEWEEGRLQAMKEEEDRLRQEDSDERLTYSSDDSRNQVSSDDDDEGDEDGDDEEEEENEQQDSSSEEDKPLQRRRLPRKKNKKAEESPRTRSRGHVSINLWTLDDRPLPCRKQRNSGGRGGGPPLNGHDEQLSLPNGQK